jgi:LuxR family maltose regulon positive regulatory protein
MATHGTSQVGTRARRSAVSAGDPVLTAKITAPGVPEWAVQRPRITKLIAEDVRWCQLTVVTGPPGAGKTTALALWAVAEPGIVAWVCLDEFDNRPGVFWSYVVAALRESGVTLPRALPAALRRMGDHVFLLQLAAALACQDPPVTLVLDDLHLLTAPKLLDGLDYVLRNVGPGLRLVASSRMDSLLPVHRYRLAGELAEIPASDLAFSTAEAGLLLARHGSTLTAGHSTGAAVGPRRSAGHVHPGPGQRRSGY